jgi:DNA polymerase III delta prime subunit
MKTSKIKSIKYVGKEQTYNISMKKNKNFFLGNGILTHNTQPAQKALRDIIVKHQNVTRFIFAVNDLSKVIEPIQDRAQVFRFKPNLIAELASGSMRRGVNALQSVYIQPEINDSIIRELMNSILCGKDIDKLIELVKTGNVEIYEKFLFELIYNHGYDPDEIMNGIIDSLIKSNNGNLLPIVVGMADYQWKMSQGSNPLLQLRCGLMKLSQSKV